MGVMGCNTNKPGLIRVMELSPYYGYWVGVVRIS